MEELDSPELRDASAASDGELLSPLSRAEPATAPARAGPRWPRLLAGLASVTSLAALVCWGLPLRDVAPASAPSTGEWTQLSVVRLHHRGSGHGGHRHQPPHGKRRAQVHADMRGHRHTSLDWSNLTGRGTRCPGFVDVANLGRFALVNAGTASKYAAEPEEEDDEEEDGPPAADGATAAHGGFYGSTRRGGANAAGGGAQQGAAPGGDARGGGGFSWQWFARLLRRRGRAAQGNHTRAKKKKHVSQQSNLAVAVSRTHRVVPFMWGRTYFADACSPYYIDPTQYAGLKLMHKALQWSVHLGGAHCGCNAALYLVSMRQNRELGKCEDYYCDANAVCGVKCAEIDLQEANMHAWRSTLHSKMDKAGKGAGLGGDLHAFGPGQYGPNGRCVDTRRPFRARATFREHAVLIQLFQPGKHCRLHLMPRKYHNMFVLRRALAEGMTPVISYWKAGDMEWMDGRVCKRDFPKTCGEAVQFWNFRLLE